MAKTLIIVESPAKSKTIQKYLGDDYIVKASFGHVRDLPPDEFGVDIDNNFKPTYKVNKDKVKTVKELLDLSTKVDRIFLASDPDREGEAIAWHLSTILKKNCSNIFRVEFHEITQKAVKEAILNPHQINLNLVNSQQARRILDRIVGYELSPWLSSSLGTKLSAGRVQSVSLRIICDRHNEILNFKPEEYWKIYANLSSQKENIPFEAELSQKGNNKIEIPNEMVAKQILNDLQNKTYSVKQIIKKEKNKNPAAPFTTSTLQQDAIRKLKWDSKKVMQIAQQLYEGISVNDGTHGLITYMRTDSTRISEDFQKETLNYVSNKWGNKYIPNTPNIYKTNNQAQDAHEAIRPTSYDREPELIKSYLTEDQFLLYKLIWERYIASQMASAIYDTVTAIISASDYLFKANGYTIRFNGFMTLYVEDKDEEENENKEENEKKLPQLNENDNLNLLKLNPKQKFTQPPVRYTEASLIKELEKLEIGRPSTYATIISVLKDRNYVELKSQKFYPTELGLNVVGILVKYFPEIMEIKFTARMESDLDDIAIKKNIWYNVLNDFYTPFSKSLSKAKEEVKPQNLKLTDDICPNCGKQMAIRKGKNGLFLSCSGYPDCKTIMPYIDDSQKTNIKCDICGKPMIIKTINNKYFLGCSGYPECKYTLPCDKKGNIIEKPKVEISDKKCPDCGKPMVIREGKNGKFYACSGYPKCKTTEPFIDTNQPTKKCDKCGKPMIIRKGSNGYFWACSGYPECKNALSCDKKGNLVNKPKAEISDKKCSECGKPMIIREGKNGKFYACSGYPNCTHTEKYN